MTWFPLFLTACVLLAAYGKPEDRPAWTVICAAGLLNLLLGLTVDRWDSPLKLPLFSSLELLTVYGLRKFAWNRMGVLQSFACLSAWTAHMLLVIDLYTGLSMIYDNYETVILGIAAYQMLLGSDGFIHMLSALFGWRDSSRSVHGAPGLSGVSLHTRRSKILPWA